MLIKHHTKGGFPVRTESKLKLFPTYLLKSKLKLLAPFSWIPSSPSTTPPCMHCSRALSPVQCSPIKPCAFSLLWLFFCHLPYYSALYLSPRAVLAHGDHSCLWLPMALNNTYILYMFIIYLFYRKGNTTLEMSVILHKITATKCQWHESDSGIKLRLLSVQNPLLLLRILLFSALYSKHWVSTLCGSFGSLKGCKMEVLAEKQYSCYLQSQVTLSHWWSRWLRTG